MSIDYAAGSRLELNDDNTGIDPRLGTSTLAYCPAFNLSSLFVNRPGAIQIPGTGSPNRPPDTIVAFMNAASFRVDVEISGEGTSASFNESIALGMVEQRGELNTSEGEPVTTLADRWQWAQFEEVPALPRVPFAETFLEVFNEVGEGQELLRFRAFLNTQSTFTSVFYSIPEDLWSISFSFSVGANDGIFGGSQSFAEYSPFASAEDTFSTGFTLMGFECPLKLREGSSVSGEITVESYLTRY